MTHIALDEKILSMLRHHTSSYVSGEDLCKAFDVSRAAIWKHMEKMREEGYSIEASPHLGYRLLGVPDRLVPSEIRWKLKTKVLGKEVISYKKVGSTNDVAYALAEKGLKEGVIILAEEQDKGKGRHGRSWTSPSRGGIYLSAILRPRITPNEIPKITLLAAVAAAKAIREVTGLQAMIKWPNDILVSGKKVCGILTEMKAEQDSVSFIVIGIGINCNTPVRQLPKSASSLREELGLHARDEHVPRLELVKKLIEKLEEDYFLLKKDGFRPIMEEWKHLTDMLGARVRVVLQNRAFEGLAHNIDPDGALIVRKDAGTLERISSGDIIMIRQG
ncbi:MAG: biotin--[acetyl-CoA-carboxylase] ligase [Candidatus Omnitrophica bacterium]|nr:biotin--[acetyl-CoA-carboxylase] ligase [Candidatus Omnitrophota bacterium]